MRWVDKPRKKTPREIVLEYIKFLKIMGYYHLAVNNMYNLSRLRGNYVRLYENNLVKPYRIDMLMYNQNMIRYLEANVCYDRYLVKYHCTRFISLLGLEYIETMNLTELLWPYFKEKHIDNCIIVN